jgi:hypothetical protein
MDTRLKPREIRTTIDIPTLVALMEINCLERNG